MIPNTRKMRDYTRDSTTPGQNSSINGTTGYRPTLCQNNPKHLSAPGTNLTPDVFKLMHVKFKDYSKCTDGIAHVNKF